MAAASALEVCKNCGHYRSHWRHSWSKDTMTHVFASPQRCANCELRPRHFTARGASLYCDECLERIAPHDPAYEELEPCKEREETKDG